MPKLLMFLTTRGNMGNLTRARYQINLMLYVALGDNSLGKSFGNSSQYSSNNFFTSSSVSSPLLHFLPNNIPTTYIYIYI